MPKGKLPGRKVTLWLPERHAKIYRRIENKSKFLQVCLEDAAGIMAMAILRERDPRYTSPRKFDEEIDGYNRAFPLDDLTKARLKQKENDECQPHSQTKQELW